VSCNQYHLPLPTFTDMTMNMDEKTSGIDRPKTLIIVGAGQRGQVSIHPSSIKAKNADQPPQIYSTYATQHPSLIKVIGVADLSAFRRKVTAREHRYGSSRLSSTDPFSIESGMVFERWQDIISQGRIADAVVIGLQVCLDEDMTTRTDTDFRMLCMRKPYLPFPAKATISCARNQWRPRLATASICFVMSLPKP
jgi:hypothetical protein